MGRVPERVQGERARRHQGEEADRVQEFKAVCDVSGLPQGVGSGVFTRGVSVPGTTITTVAAPHMQLHGQSKATSSPL